MQVKKLLPSSSASEDGVEVFVFARVVITLAHVLRGFQRGRSTGRVLGGNKQPFSRCRPSRVRIGAIQILEENMPVAVHLATN